MSSDQQSLQPPLARQLPLEVVQPLGHIGSVVQAPAPEQVVKQPHDALHSIPSPQLPSPVQRAAQKPVPQVTPWSHEPGPSQVMLQALAAVQSTPP